MLAFREQARQTCLFEESRRGRLARSKRAGEADFLARREQARQIACSKSAGEADLLARREQTKRTSIDQASLGFFLEWFIKHASADLKKGLHERRTYLSLLF